MAELKTLSKSALVKQLQSLHLNSTGSKEQLLRRLTNHRKKCKKYENRRFDRFFDFLIVIDFECTCEQYMPNFPHEIIEFPAVLLRLEDLVVVDVFRQFCRPVFMPTLTQFCTELTGITQADVDSALTFPEVLSSFYNWMAGHGLGTSKHYAFVSDGPWDLGKFMQLQCMISGIPVPHEFRSWISLRKAFRNFHNARSYSLLGMLTRLGMTFQGREHCGLDDAQNIARIAIELMRSGCQLRINERLRHKRPPHSQPLTNAGQNAEFETSSSSEDDETKKSQQTEPEQTEPKITAKQQVHAALGVVRTKPEVKPPLAVSHHTDQGPPEWRRFKRFEFKVVPVTKHEFDLDLYLECDTCESEAES